MREIPLSVCEKDFILRSIEKRLRLDGRNAYDYRRIKITYGIDRGCCHVELGETVVMAQVSCEVVSPTQNRPTDGVIHVNVELSPMASPGFEGGRLSEFGVEVNRQLERCIKESRCLDTESLCIVAGEKVWQIRVDVHILNHEGNLIDAGSIAAIAALLHYRRPDVSVFGEEVIVHPVTDKDPIPLSVLHMPICVTFAFFKQGKYLLLDSTYKEELVMDGKMVIGMNKHREICTLQMTGDMMLLKDQVQRCSNIAVVKVSEITKLIQEALENDTAARAAGKKFGFAESVPTSKISANESEEQSVSIETVNKAAREVIQNGTEDVDMDQEDLEVKIMGPGTGKIGEGGASTWDIDEDIKHFNTDKRPKAKTPMLNTDGDLSGDSEEEETVVVGQEELGLAQKRCTKQASTGDSAPKSIKKGKKSKRKQVMN